MFKLKSPCVTCPFKVGMGDKFNLDPDRLEDIRRAVAFQCHKTVDYENVEVREDGEEKPGQGEHPNQCAGLMAVLHRMGEPNQIMQLAYRLGELDPATLDPRNEAYPSWEAVLAAHGPSKRTTRR